MLFQKLDERAGINYAPMGLAMIDPRVPVVIAARHFTAKLVSLFSLSRSWDKCLRTGT